MFTSYIENMLTKIVYKVEARRIYTGSRIEGVKSEITLYQTEKDAMKSAFELAYLYFQENSELPMNQENELIMSDEYIWPSEDYGDCYPKYAIYVEPLKMYLDSSVITSLTVRV